MSEKKVLVRIRGLAKDYKRGVETVHVLEKLDLDIREGDFLAMDYDLVAASEATGLAQYELLTGLSSRFERLWS